MIDPIEKSDLDIDQIPFEIEALAARYKAERDVAIQARERLEKEVGILRGAEHERDMLRDLADVLVVKVIEHPTGRTFAEGLDDAEIDDRIDSIIEAIDRRLLPEGYEWPRYETGELLRYKDRYIHDGAEREVWHVDFDSYGDATILNNDGSKCSLDKGERVRRPAPKVLDADGAPIHEGETVYGVEHGTEYTVCEVGLQSVTVEYWCAGISAHSSIVPSLLTHRRPVLDADGVEIRVGDTVWDTETGCGRTVRAVNDNGTVEFEGYEDCGWLTKFLTHERPVLDADGRPLRVGDTVWEVETGDVYVVERIYSGTTEPDFPGHTVACRRPDDIVTHMFNPSQLTHERPDSWDRLEEDADKNPFDYCKDVGHRLDTCEDSEAYKARDLVRRAKKLAGAS